MSVVEEGNGREATFMLHVTQQKFIKMDMNLWHVHAAEDNFPTKKSVFETSSVSFCVAINAPPITKTVDKNILTSHSARSGLYINQGMHNVI